MSEILVITYLILLSSVKFLFVPFLSVHIHNFNYLTAVLINISGSFIGITFFFKTSSYFFDLAIKKRQRAIESESTNKKKVFTRMNRLLVRVKETMGMYGLAFIILPFLSIPISAIVSAKYYHLKKKKMLILLYVSSVVWSFLLSGIAFLI
jgi:hypothetical protein